MRMPMSSLRFASIINVSHKVYITHTLMWIMGLEPICFLALESESNVYSYSTISTSYRKTSEGVAHKGIKSEVRQPLHL